MKLALARRRDQPKLHSIERKLRIASRDLSVAFDCVANDTQSVFFQRLRQLETVRIVDVDD